MIEPDSQREAEADDALDRAIALSDERVLRSALRAAERLLDERDGIRAAGDAGAVRVPGSDSIPPWPRWPDGRAVVPTPPVVVADPMSPTTAVIRSFDRLVLLDGQWFLTNGYEGYYPLGDGSTPVPTPGNMARGGELLAVGDVVELDGERSRVSSFGISDDGRSLGCELMDGRVAPARALRFVGRLRFVGSAADGKEG